MVEILTRAHEGSEIEPAVEESSPDVQDTPSVYSTLDGWQKSGHNPQSGELILKRLSLNSPTGYETVRVMPNQFIKPELGLEPEDQVAPEPAINNQERAPHDSRSLQQFEAPDQTDQSEQPDENKEVTTSALDLLEANITKSETIIAQLEHQLDELKSKIKQLIDLNQFDIASSYLKQAAIFKASLKNQKKYLNRQKREILFFKEYSSPANILRLKEKFDNKLQPEIDRRRRLQDDEPINTYAELLKNHLVDEYLQTGTDPEKPRDISAGLKQEVLEMMAKSYDELEARLPKQTPEPEPIVAQRADPDGGAADNQPNDSAPSVEGLDLTAGANPETTGANTDVPAQQPFEATESGSAPEPGTTYVSEPASEAEPEAELSPAVSLLDQILGRVNTAAAEARGRTRRAVQRLGKIGRRGAQV